jgi:alpha-D-xyloside xylohydrolase
LRLGLDGFKADRGDAFDLEPEQLAGGDGVALHNAFPVSYAEAVAGAFRAAGRRPAGMFRAGFSGSQRLVPAVWAGDQESSFAGLQQAVRMGQPAGVSGFPIWGSDIGGYHAGFEGKAAVTPELFVRWAQFAAVTPLFEVGGAGRNARFWELGTRATELFRRAAVLHYELAPYLYTLARTASATGSPILRPLGFSYPHDEQAWTHDLEFLVGPDLLAAPVSSSGRRVDVYLPKGEWVDLVRGNTLRGPVRYARPTPLDELPLYLRSGAAIPFDFRTPDVWADPWRVNDLLRSGRAGWLYAPGGGATLTVSKEAGRLRVVSRGSTLTLSFSGAPRELQALVLTRAAPRGVTIGGRVVPAARSLAELRRSHEGWTRRADGPFAGVVLKLAPADGAELVTLELPPTR